MHVLEGVVVLDFTQGMPGSVATMALSDFGAEVIKIDLFVKTPRQPGARWG